MAKTSNDKKSPLAQRRAGILLHPTSLPGGTGGNGDFGSEAYRFVEFAAAAGFSLWQMLPLGPTHADGSPYQCLSVHAGNPRLISLELVRHDGWLPKDAPIHDLDKRHELLQAAREGFFKHAKKQDQQAYEKFVATKKHWLEDYSLYQALRHENGMRPWWEWPAAARDRDEKAMADARERLSYWIQQQFFEQYLFFKQFESVRSYAHSKGLLLFGDMPIFVAYDSADVWAERRNFLLDETGRPTVVAGVPPDYFSATGQKWGNPLYNWDVMAKDKFSWWVERMRTQLEMFDVVRIDHFRGFEAYWEVPADAPDAMTGRWIKAPGDALFAAMRDALGSLPVVAEDLGIITDEVTALRRNHGFPGMKILQFAFDGDNNNHYLPHNHEVDSVIYTGTHDNDTTLGWYNTTSEQNRQLMREYCGQPSEPMPWPMVRWALASVANLAVIPMQDLLQLGQEHRMNIPGTDGRNWGWRYRWDQVPTDLANRVRRMNWICNRCL